MKKILFQTFFVSVVYCIVVFAQEESMHCLISPPSIPPPYGNILPSIGTVNVLIVFAQFPDDTYDINNATWVKGQAPASMGNWINQTWTSSPTQGSLTHYFNDMSFNNFKLIGKTVSATAPHSRQWYLSQSPIKKRWDIQKEILQQLDASWDFAEFDNWNSDKNNIPDGKVDMIIFVWRNIAKELPNESDIKISLNFDNDYGSLGFTSNFDYNYFEVDGGSRKIYANDYGSGVTIRDLAFYGYQSRFRIVVHEVAHYLLGHNDYHCGFGFWGMLSSFGIKSMVANSFERSRLGWITLQIIQAGSLQTYPNMTLRDYVSTGDAYALEVDPSTGQYFYIENHQATSYWETTRAFGNIEPGLYVLRKDATTPSSSNDNPSSANFRMIPADGRYDWIVNQQVPNPWGSGNLPVYKNLGSDRQTGYHDLEFIPWIWGGVPKTPASIHFTENINGLPVMDVRYQGDGKDAFRLGYNDKFSPWTNPNNQGKNRSTTGFGFKINSCNNGVYSIDIHRGLNEYVINQNTVLSYGDWNISSNVTVNSGVTLTIQPGTTLRFASGTNLTINGVLHAVGTSSQRITFTGTSPSSTWSGIFMNGSGANNSVMEYCNVSNVLSYGGSAVSVIEATGFAIRHCNITNNVNYNTNGIYFSNADSPEIYADTVSSNGGFGVVFFNTNGNIYGNTLSSNSFGGISCSYCASPSFGKIGFAAYYGNNLITGGLYGIYTGSYSYPYVGSQYNSYYGYNNITGSSSARIYASGYSDVMAENNWWGSATPDPNWFQTYNNSYIEWYPALTYNPGGGAPKIVPSALTEEGIQTLSLAKIASGTPADGTLKAQIRSIMDLRAKQDYDGAKNNLCKLLTNTDNIEDAKCISPAMIALCRERQDKQLLNACTQFLEKLGGKDPLLQLALAQIYIQNSRHSDAMSLLSQVVSSNPNTEYEKYALLDQFYNAFSSSGSAKDLGTITEVLKNKYNDDPSVQQALWTYAPKVESHLINPLQPGLSEKTLTQTNNETILVRSYPNPFNPTTVINYQLPDVGMQYVVSLRVYDMLGRVAATLVDGTREAGTYTASFDGSHLASGIYFARFTATPQNGSKPFNQTMKMLMTK
ncbi:MAG: T9SS type A sorting domain-containing protein [Ignavibacteriales bacterium]|nr:T9SS type A sorting domain-containing protein [Ignavibacteriales bacterium]